MNTTTLDHLARATESLAELARLLAAEIEPDAGGALADARLFVAEAIEQATLDAAESAYGVAYGNLNVAAEQAARAAESASTCEDDEESASTWEDEQYSTARAAFSAAEAAFSAAKSRRAVRPSSAGALPQEGTRSRSPVT